MLLFDIIHDDDPTFFDDFIVRADIDNIPAWVPSSRYHEEYLRDPAKFRSSSLSIISLDSNKFKSTFIKDFQYYTMDEDLPPPPPIPDRKLQQLAPPVRGVPVHPGREGFDRPVDFLPDGQQRLFSSSAEEDNDSLSNDPTMEPKAADASHPSVKNLTKAMENTKWT